MKYLKKFENYSEPQTLIDIIFSRLIPWTDSLIEK